jgi:tRNA(Ile2) C34 agmatinyltransferase TiaS
MAPAETHDVVCPHCHKEFAGELLGSGEQTGYKCPHCRLFVPFERADEPEPEPVEQA